jgi:hypothetical protein
LSSGESELSSSFSLTFCEKPLSLLEKLQPRLKIVKKKGRFREEANYELYLGSEAGIRLLVLKCFAGRPPHYARWIEVFSVLPEIDMGRGKIPFAGSELEALLLGLLAEELEGGESLFVEYTYDPETSKLLKLGAHPVVTRLGFLLFQLGFTWFKDWYFPEGFMEGSPKLQCEKPVCEEARLKHLAKLREEVAAFIPELERLSSDLRLGAEALRALERAKAVLQATAGSASRANVQQNFEEGFK